MRGAGGELAPRLASASPALMQSTPLLSSSAAKAAEGFVDEPQTWEKLLFALELTQTAKTEQGAC